MAVAVIAAVLVLVVVRLVHLEAEIRRITATRNATAETSGRGGGTRW